MTNNGPMIYSAPKFYKKNRGLPNMEEGERKEKKRIKNY